jgi:hypothetical protein
VPIDQQMLEFLVEHEIFEQGTTVADAQRFLENHLKAEECYEFYMACRAAAQESANDDKKKKKK